MTRLLTRGFLLIIRGYQLLISPMLGPRCRFLPSCSHYAQEALQVHGLRRGGWLALRRIGRCNPWHPWRARSRPAGQHGQHTHRP